MLSRVVGLLFLCIAAHASEAQELTHSRGLLNSPPRESFQDTPNALVSAHGAATVDAVAEVGNEFGLAIAGAIADVAAGANVTTTAQSEANAYANAVAETYLDAMIDVAVELGSDVACEEGFLEASVAARAFADGFLEVLAQASETNNFPNVESSADAIVAATVDAFEEVHAAVCGQSGSTLDVAEANLAASIAESSNAILFEVLSNVRTGSIGAETSGEARVAYTSTAPPCRSIDLRNCCREATAICECRPRLGCQAKRIDIFEEQLVYEVIATNSDLGPQVGDECVCP